MVFINRVGTEGDLAFWGISHIVDLLGGITVGAAPYKEAVIIADLDLKSVMRRRKVPLLREARLGLLSRELNRLIEEGGDL